MEDRAKDLCRLTFLFAAQPWLSAYIVEEALTVLLVIAVLHLVILLTAIAFLLLWQGAIFTFLQLKRIIGRITNVRDRPLALSRR